MSVTFTGNTATHQLGNGKTIHYKLYQGTYYHQNTPDEVVRILAACQKNPRRIRLHYGETDPSQPDVGRDWNEENDVTGTVGRSTGQLKIPLVVADKDNGGPHMLDHRIVKIRLAEGKNRTVLYQHPQYKPSQFTPVRISPDEMTHDQKSLLESGYTIGVNIDGQRNANFKTAQGAAKYLTEMTGEQYSVRNGFPVKT